MSGKSALRAGSTIAATLALLLLAACGPTALPPARAPSANGMEASQAGLAGTWTLVRSTDVTPSGQRDYYGPNPKGRLTFDRSGRYTLVVLRSDLPDYAPKDRGSDDANRQIVAGSISNYGSYSVQGKTLLLTVTGSSYRRWETEHGANGTKGPQPRLFELNGDRLTYVVNPSSSNGIAEFEWRREPETMPAAAP
jgi:hypothetical protein